MKNYIVFAIAIFVFNSCGRDGDEGSKTPYFKFEDSDYELMINYDYDIDQIITYKNQFGEEVHFKVVSNVEEKAGMYLGSYWGSHSSLLFYYDRKIIRLEIMGNQSFGDEDELVNYIFSKSNDYMTDYERGEFKNVINFPIWNVPSFSFLDEMQNPFNITLRGYNYASKTQMNINGHLFERVVSIESGSDSLDLGFGTLPNNVNKLFYDYDFGIVRFDDLDGKQWEVLYPN